MALTQQFARVTPEHRERLRTGTEEWDPGAENLLDTGWAVWGLIRFCRASGADPDTVALLDRAVSGDPDGDVAFLDHDGVYDGFTDPPRLLEPTAVADIARALDALDPGALLAELPDSPDEASAVCGLGPLSDGDVRGHLVEHLTAMREFYGEAAIHGQCVVTWID
ncbi:DUF1877 family protein [Streptomyces griseorubiginosus]|uniref:DUF1877 family protein n=1 Tax=Streptomyces griseorubiginosus TaxID=67304 RepID=A0A117R0I7_9ACTN|nr:DUF1877 family protein [Streptomyces griseorubiginosus]KUN64381.1 hypothetical protein AQJ54_25530 [Streptomyces griseorubiginosus]